MKATTGTGNTASDELSAHSLPEQWPSNPAVRFTSSRTSVDVQPAMSNAAERTAVITFD
jgi:hypothetical protein